MDISASGDRFDIFRSDDLGEMWYRVAAPRGITPSSLTALPDGRILVQDADDFTLSIHALEAFRPEGGEGTATPGD